MVECVVEFDYDAQEEDELSIKVGDVLSDVVKHSGGWWEGMLNGNKGMFPDNFVKEIKKEKVEKAKEPPKKQTSAGNVANLANKLGSNIQMGPAPKALIRGEQNSEKKKLRAKVTYSYTPQNEDEVKLIEGDIVEIIQQEEEGWWEGIARGHKGVFPSNFVEVIKDEEKPEKAASGDEAETPTEGEVHEIKGKRIRGVGFGNIFGDGGPKLRKADGQTEVPKPAPELKQSNSKKGALPALPKDPPAGMESAVKAPTLPPKNDAKPPERAKALHSYRAENDDELTFHEGNIINILDKKVEDSGWWKGELNGRVGLFPDNFVELLPPVEDAHRPKKPPPPLVPPNNSKPSARAPPPDPKPEKKEEVKEKVLPVSDDRPPKAVFTKKAIVPPPVGKKPAAKPTESKTDDQKAIESQPEENHAENPPLDPVESSAQKLSHPTANRAKAPSQRRPPTSVKDLPQKPAEEESVEETTDEKPLEPPERRKSRPKNLQPPQPPMPLMREKPQEPRESDGASKKSVRPPPPASTPTKEPPKPAAKSPIPEEMFGSHSSAPGAPGPEVEQLKRDLEQLKANSVPRSQYEELLSDVKTLTEQMGNLKTLFNKRIIDLMNEVDEEKKIRLNMQVEIDRIKKLSLSS